MHGNPSSNYTGSPMPTGLSSTTATLAPAKELPVEITAYEMGVQRLLEAISNLQIKVEPMCRISDMKDEAIPKAVRNTTLGYRIGEANDLLEYQINRLNRLTQLIEL